MAKRLSDHQPSRPPSSHTTRDIQPLRLDHPEGGEQMYVFENRLVPVPQLVGQETLLAWQFLPRHGLAKYRSFGGMNSYFTRPPRHDYNLSRGGFEKGGGGAKVWSRAPPGTGDKSIVR